MNREISELELQSALSGRYTDFSKIGEGGMAVVYKAHDTVLLRHVAIKTLRIKSMTPDMVTHFQREARAAGKLQHPNVVTVLDFGMSEQIPYLIMDFAGGETLATLVEEKKKIPLQEAVKFAAEVCRGMAFAHSNGVVHRDLKPSNIVILSQPEPDARVKIVDFGIAKIVQSLTGADEIGAATAAHHIDGRISNSQLIGSPFYMSPEQIRGEIIDARSDIYSFGCTLYQMLTGKVPFCGENKLETFELHLKSAPPLILDPSVPQVLSDLVMRCLEKDPNKRPNSMTEISELLAKCLETERPVETTSRSSTARLRLMRAVAVLLLVLSAWVFAIMQNQNKPALPSRAQLEEAKVQKTIGRKWDRKKASDGREVWEASAGVTDAELEPLIRNNASYVTLRGAKITNVGLDSLAAVPILELDLTQTGLDDSAASHLSRFRSLTRLDLSCTKFTDVGIDELDLPNLINLELDETAVSDRGMETIVTRWPNLEYLNISNTKITSKGLLKLAKMKKLVGLEVADLTLDDAAMKVVTSMPVRTLSLNASQFPKKWLADVGKMKTVKTLTISKLRDCTIKDYNDLRARMPWCRIRCVEFATDQMSDVAEYLKFMD